MAKAASASFLRRKAVAFELGITRHTLARVIKTDPEFPRFFEISPGVQVIERADLEKWLRRKKLSAYKNGPALPTLDQDHQQ